MTTYWQVKAELHKKIIYFGMATTKEDPRAAALLSLGPRWFGATITVTAIEPKSKRKARRDARASSQD